MVLYEIGGLGADKRVFEKLNLSVPSIFITWLKTEKKESLTGYALRLSKQIDQSQEFGIIGVSFGGIIAVELSKILKPKVVILISSVSNSDELPFHYLRRPFSKLINLIPIRLMKPPKFIMNYMFGAVDQDLLSKILMDTDPHFIKWALHKILIWTGEISEGEFLRIHGSNDRLIPVMGNAQMIEGGGHFMIVDRADEVSKLINEYLESI